MARNVEIPARRYIVAPLDRSASKPNEDRAIAAVPHVIRSF